MILPTDTASLPQGQAPARAALDVALLGKYAVAAPRYTSYPPATRFTDDLPSLRLEDAIREDNAPGAGPLSLYFHIPFCQSACWYCGCNTIVTQRADAAAAYVDDLEREVRAMAARMDRTRPVSQVHFGGGTPNFLPAADLLRLGALIRDTFTLAPDCEFGVELDPRRLTRDQVAALRSMGVNRASLGVQDTDPEVQKAIHRVQPCECNAAAFAWLREAGITSINVDLIYGLPLQTVESFSRTIDSVLALGPDRLSVFSYAHVPWVKPLQKVFDYRHQLPAAPEKLAMFVAAHTRLAGAGYTDIGLDHFARPDDELAVAQRNGTLQRNFQGYSTHGGHSLYGFGLSSISSTAGTYRQNLKTMGPWRDAIAAGGLPVERGYRLTAEDARRRTLIMRLMCDRRMDYARLSAETGVDVAQAYAAEIAGLDDLERDGLLERFAGGLVVTPRGVPLLRVIAVRFDDSFGTAPGRHSNSV